MPEAATWVRARSVSDAGARVLYADGQHVSLLDETMNVYTTTPLAGTIDPPKDAEKIVMTTIEEANAADAKGGTK